MGVDRLVAVVVFFLRLAVQVGGKGDDTHGVDDLRQREPSCPAQFHHPGVAHGFVACGGEGDGLSAYFGSPLQRPLFPFLVVADEAEPGAVFPLLESLCHRHMVRLEAEHLDGRACGLAEEEAGMDDAGVVEHQQRAIGQVVADAVEEALANLAVAVDEELRLIAPFQWELGDALVGQGVVVVGDGDGLRVTHGRGLCVG